MLDIEALEAAGFAKLMTTEEWEKANAAAPNPRVEYRLSRGEVLIATERNTQEQSPHGISTTVRYPEIAIIWHAFAAAQRVTCDASNTDLILALADEVGADRKKRQHHG